MGPSAVEFEVQLSTPRIMNADECFPSYFKMDLLIGKGILRERKREGVGADFKS
jgi:hypothetical protein